MHKGKNVEQDSITESAFLYYYQEKQSSWCSKLNTYQMSSKGSQMTLWQKRNKARS